MIGIRDDPAAGAFARQHFDELNKRWRHRARLAFPLAAAPLAAWVVAMALAFPHLRQLCLGVGIGALATLYLCVLDSPPEWIAKWGRGADGERQTARALRRHRRSGWCLVHGLDGPRGDRDHVIAGAPGVFLLETKNLGGTITIEHGGVHSRHSDDPLDQWSNRWIAQHVKRSAAELQRDLAAHGVRWVHPVVVIWGDFPAGRVQRDGVVYLHGKQLAGWLDEQPPALSEPSLQSIFDALRQAPRAGRFAARQLKV